MIEIYRTNDIVKLSWLQALMSDAGIDCLVLDQHASIMDGSIGAVQRRLVVSEDDAIRATRVLTDAGELSAEEARSRL
ncbi:DUF2007 domain-containing protein [Kiloniella laminariae]|uniref:DUF2007 domain-containing protein n=1 Tax=Kiloniella laminariae TaxID=454162 RepID=A0ABT4LEK3_9PROT|nr:DUF2007 domain-containing protein [Kiloniella laminariae]MCZ4279524.1 DUF2007 domain-containing protein [Kiloniella laminariae]